MRSFLLDFSFIVKPTIYSVKSLFVRLQADNSLRADVCIMSKAGRQVDPIARLQGELLSKLRQAERNASLHHINDFVIGMRMHSINIKGTMNTDLILHRSCVARAWIGPG